jgi:hypothetical protein
MRTDPPATGRLLGVALFASVVAVVLATVTLLRPSRPADDASAELAALRAELVDLRRSVDLTRSRSSAPGGFGDLAELERRVAQLEAPPTRSVAAVPVAPPPAALEPDVAPPEDRPPEARPAPARPGKPAPSYSSPHPAIRLEQGPGGRLIVHNSDPELTGQEMTVFGLDADGRETQTTITVPAPG